MPDVYTPEELAGTRNVPFGGQKYRMHQVSAAIGLANHAKLQGWTTLRKFKYTDND